jgi:hypothetical protein
MNLTREEQTQMLAALVRDGLLKVRARWFEAVDFVRLPEHTRRQVQETRLIVRKGRASTLVRFYRPRKA